MAELKHVGRLTTNKRKLMVAYRTLPGDPYTALVVHTESLDADQHDALINLVQSNTGQTCYELAEAMARTRLPDGRIMLSAFHQQGKLVKVPTNIVEMTPTTQASVLLSELNEAIAKQKGVPIDELAIKDGSSSTPVQETVAEPTPVVEPAVEPLQSATDEVLTDEALAKKYRSDADRLSKEAAELRRQAEALVPTKKKKTSA